MLQSRASRHDQNGGRSGSRPLEESKREGRRRFNGKSGTPGLLEGTLNLGFADRFPSSSGPVDDFEQALTMHGLANRDAVGQGCSQRAARSRQRCTLLGLDPDESGKARGEAFGQAEEERAIADRQPYFLG